ncbi:MAG: type I restriction enzyme HsdR N-terminal domain-containing protein [Actinomycetes bacterium]
MAVYQQKARERIQKSLRKFTRVVDRARENNANESDTRLIVTAILGEALGWDTFEHVTGEHRIKGNYADFAIHQGKDILAIIEVKAVGTTLGPKHLYQAVSYAANEGVEWVWLTNGCDWQIYKVVFGKPVEQDLAFQVSICDVEMRPKDKTELLYLLSFEAQRTHELDAYYTKKAALSGANAARVLLKEKMLRTLRGEMRAATGHLATLEEIATILVEEVIRPEVLGDDTARLVRKAAALGRTTKKNVAKAAIGSESFIADPLAEGSAGGQPSSSA